MNGKFVTYLFPIGGGIIGSAFKSKAILLALSGFITWQQIVIVIIFAFIGATVGYFTKRFWDKIFKNK